MFWLPVCGAPGAHTYTHKFSQQQVPVRLFLFLLFLLLLLLQLLLLLHALLQTSCPPHALLHPALSVSAALMQGMPEFSYNANKTKQKRQTKNETNAKK